MTKSNQTQHYIHQKHKRGTDKNRPSQQNNLHPDLVRFLQPPVRKWSGPYSYSPGAHTGHYKQTPTWRTHTNASHPADTQTETH